MGNVFCRRCQESENDQQQVVEAIVSNSDPDSILIYPYPICTPPSSSSSSSSSYSSSSSCYPHYQK